MDLTKDFLKGMSWDCLQMLSRFIARPRQVCVAMGQVVGSQSRQLHLRPLSPNETFSDAASRREEQLRGERGGGGRRDEAALPVEMQAKRSQGLALLLNNPESNLDDLITVILRPPNPMHYV